VRAVDRGRHLRAEDESASAPIERLVLRLSRFAGAAQLSLGIRTTDLPALEGRAAVLADPGPSAMEADLHVHSDERSAMRLVSLLGMDFLALTRR
jgi:hypothetical protein